MFRKSGFLLVLFLLTLGLIAISPQWTLSQNLHVSEKMMCSKMMGGRMRGPQNHGDMQLVHQLFANHDLINRTVEEISGGIRATTESDNPKVAAMIQNHVGSMYQRLEDGRFFAMMSNTLPIMFQNSDRYQRQLEITTKGVVITETSDDLDMVEVIREHGREVNQFVEQGMSTMCGGMMR